MQGAKKAEVLDHTLARFKAAAAALTAEAVCRWFRASCLFDPSPDPEISWEPADYGFDPAAVEERIFRGEEGNSLHGWYCRAENPQGSILFCHGNTGNLTTAAGGIRFLVERGFDVLIFDYRGYGKSEGRPSLRGLLADARAAAVEHSRLRPDGRPSLLYGYSLGGAIAAQAAPHHAFDGLILQSTFTNFAEITQHLYPNLPFEWLCGDHLDTDAVLASIPLPVLIIHGSNDEVVPCDMGIRLHELCDGRGMLEIVEGGLHKDKDCFHASRIAAAVERFMIRHLSAERECLTEACA